MSAEDSKEFMEFADNFEYFEHAAITERRINEVSRIKDTNKHPGDRRGPHRAGRGPRGPGGEKPNPEDSLRYSSLDHQSDRTDISPEIPLDQLFENGTTLLQPQAFEGPFYVGGELIREDITDGEPGVPLWISANFYDITSGKPVEMYWEVWHCNSTGSYSGVDSPINSNGDNLLDETFLRGIQKTDKNGAATFKTVFPGHYAGRAVHIHMIAHMDATEYDNGTIGIGEHGSSGRIAHVGQFFFDDTLIDKVEATDPYTTNTHTRTPNKDDREVGMLSKKDSPDPFMKYVFLGDKPEDGIYAWISIGIDASANYKPRMAAYRGENGGVKLPGGPGGPHWPGGPKHRGPGGPKHKGPGGPEGPGGPGGPAPRGPHKGGNGRGLDGKPGKGKSGKGKGELATDQPPRDHKAGHKSDGRGKHRPGRPPKKTPNDHKESNEDRQPNSTERGRRQPPKNWIGLILDRLSGAIY